MDEFAQRQPRNLGELTMSDFPEYHLSEASEQEVARYAETHDADEVLAYIQKLGEADAARDARREEKARLELDKQYAENVILDISKNVKEEWVRQNPWFPLLEEDVIQANAKMLMDRAVAVCYGKYSRELYPQSYSREGLEAYAELLRRCLTLAAQQLWEEKRFAGIDFGKPHLHTPFSEFHGTTQAVPDQPDYTEDELHDMLDRGEITMDQLKEMSDQQLAAQQNAGEVDRAVVASTDRSFALSRVPAQPASDAPVERQQGFAALAYSNRINPNGPDRK
jgi:hypothetical protein